MKLPLSVAELEQGTLHFQKARQLKYEFVSQNTDAAKIMYLLNLSFQSFFKIL